MSSQVRPSFFTSRPNGSLTPLIALDDLPAGVTVRGTSRTITAGETQGMISCGSSEPRSEPWTLEGVAPAGKGTIANDEGSPELQAILLKIIADDSVPTPLRLAINELLYRHHGASVPTAAPIAEAVTGRQPTPSVYHVNTRGNAGHKQGFNAKKEFCSYWIRHGECDYQQQGCLYKHEMPTDITMLEKLGLRDIPRWYREKFNVPSLLQANYANNHRGQHQQAAVDQPAQRTIQHHPAANNASTAGPAGPSVTANGTTNAANNASTAGPVVHAKGNNNAANNASTTGPSGHAKGITNTATNASTAGHSGHAHGNGNVSHNTGNKNNGNHPGHPHAHPRGGRYKSPRGAGFAAGKGRGNLNWGKNGRNGVIPPPANIVKETHDDDTPSTASPRTSIGSSFSISSRTRMDLLASPLVNPMTNMTLTGQPILDKEAMARKAAMTARLRQLTPEASYASPIPEEEEPEQNFFRTKTRHVFSFGADGDKIAAAKSKGTAPFDPFASLTKDETAGKTTTAALTPMIRKLVATSQPIDPNEPLINWGPIGEPVQRPAPAVNTTYAMALINGQAQTGAKGQSAYPYMGQH